LIATKARRGEVDFIEQWFGISPDGGDGSLELQWIVGIAIVVTAVVFRRRIIGWLSSRWHQRR
jgi:hypothetical protein